MSRTTLHCVTQHSVNSALCHTALSQLCTVSHSAKFNSALCLREQRLLKPEMLNCICCRNMLYCLYFLVDDIIPTQTNQYTVTLAGYDGRYHCCAWNRYNIHSNKYPGLYSIGPTAMHTHITVNNCYHCLETRYKNMEKYMENSKTIDI